MLTPFLHTKMGIPFLFLIALTNCAYLLSASENQVLYSEGRVYKMTPELVASSQSTALHSTGNTSVKNSVTITKLATTAHSKPLLFFPLNYCCTHSTFLTSYVD
jgi:hypothetical protein